MAKLIGWAFKVAGWLVALFGVLWLLSLVFSESHDKRIEGLLVALIAVVWYVSYQIANAIEAVRRQVAALHDAIDRDQSRFVP